MEKMKNIDLQNNTETTCSCCKFYNPCSGENMSKTGLCRHIKRINLHELALYVSFDEWCEYFSDHGKVHG